MKKVFEDNDTAPNIGARSPAKNTPTKAKATPKSTVKSRKAATSSGDDLEDAQTTPVSKRKRAAPREKVAATDEDTKTKPEPNNDGKNEGEIDELLEPEPKRVKADKNKRKVIPKPKPKAVVKREETDDDDEDSFFDAHEGLDHQDQSEEVHQDSYSVHDRKLPYPAISPRLHQHTEDLLAEPTDSCDFSDDFI
jgi:hypothetical protein